MLIRNQINTGLTINKLPYTIPVQTPIEAGTIMVFQQTTAPVGWTKLTTNNDNMLRVVSGAVTTAGTTVFTTVFTNQTPAVSIPASADAVTLTTAQIPAHTHGSGTSVTIALYSGYPQIPEIQAGTARTSSGPNIPVGGGSHTHAITGAIAIALNLAVAYVDVIMASKNA
jgi:hypothetical protein